MAGRRNVVPQPRDNMRKTRLDQTWEDQSMSGRCLRLSRWKLVESGSHIAIQTIAVAT